MRVYILLIASSLVGLFPGVSLAQDVKATRLSELDFWVSRSDLSVLAEKTLQFLEKMSKEPKTTKGAIMIYPNFRFKGACEDAVYESDPTVESFVKKVIKLNTEISPERVVLVNGDMSVGGHVYFWLVPGGAEIPKALPVTSFDPPCCCPTITVFGRPTVGRDVKHVRFFLHLRSESWKSRIKWSVSNGKIVSGQETNEITVALTHEDTKEITATVEVIINPGCNCPTTASFTTRISPE
jgi:hypothetical protein